MAALLTRPCAVLCCASSQVMDQNVRMAIMARKALKIKKKDPLPRNIWRVESSCLNVRAQGTHANSPIIGYLDRGDYIVCVGRQEGDWLCVSAEGGKHHKFEGSTGYVMCCSHTFASPC